MSSNICYSVKNIRLSVDFNPKYCLRSEAWGELTYDILGPVVPPGLYVGDLHAVADGLDVLGVGLGPGPEDGHCPLLYIKICVYSASCTTCICK